MRIGDADREAAVAALGEHYAAGRLTKDEFDERSDRAYAARTGSALWPLFADLPPSGRPVTGPPRPQSGSAGGGPSGQRAHGWSAGIPRGGAQPRWVGGVMPVLLVVVALSVLTHLPFFFLLFVGWLLFTKVFRLWTFGHRRDPRGPHGPYGPGPGRRVR
jgi:hypothetical protein